MNDIDNLHYELLLLENYVPHYVEYLYSFKNKNKFFEAFIRHKINKIEALCCDLFINQEGHCRWDNISAMNSRGYYIGPGEKDRFGWLTGVLTTSKGNIVFG
jgi:hypothetical protein